MTINSFALQKTGRKFDDLSSYEQDIITRDFIKEQEKTITNITDDFFKIKKSTGIVIDEILINNLKILLEERQKVAVMMLKYNQSTEIKSTYDYINSRIKELLGL